MFLSFLLRLLGGAVVPLFIFSVMEMSQFGLVALSFPRFARRTPRELAIDGLRTLVQAYVWFGWAAYCVSLVLRYAYQPMAPYDPWVFYLTAALVANIPIVYIALRERTEAGSDEEQGRLRQGTNLCRAITMVGFFLFAVSPMLMATPYGWVIGSTPAYGESVSLEEVMAGAERGVPEAQYRLGVRYSEGRGLTQNAVEAARWWRAAAEQGHVRSQSKLCGIYLDGRGVSEDDLEAARWCHSAAEQGDVHASFILGNLYTRGRGVGPDELEATRWYRRAAEGGLVEAQAIVGFRHASGADDDRDLVEAYRWLSLAASRLPFGQELTDVTEVRQDIRAQLTPDELAEAVRLVMESRSIQPQ